MPNSGTVSVVVDGLLGLAIIVGAVVLLSLGKLDASTAIALIGAGAAVAKGATSTALALKVPPPAERTPPPPGA